MRRFLVVLFLAFFANAPWVSAVLVYDGGAANLVAPADDPGWNAVGKFTASGKVGTAIFLGNNAGSAWFLTANHVPLTGNSLTINGSTYTSFLDAQRIGVADLKVFRVNSILTGVAPVSLASSKPTIGSSVIMMGYGKTGSKVTWDLSTNPWASPGTGAEGYTWSGANVMRWGENEVHARDLVINSSISFATDFDAVAGQAQGSLGDSGGAVFIKHAGDWELAGLIFTVAVTDGSSYGSSFVGQPDNTSVAAITGSPLKKSVTFSVQISEYSPAIEALIPEPSAGLLLPLGLLATTIGLRRGWPRRGEAV